MNLFISIRNYIVEFLAHQLPFIDLDEPAEPAANSVDHQPKVVLMFQTDLFFI